MSRTHGLLMLAVLALAGCGDKNIRPPKVEYVEVEKAQNLPDSLLLPCPIEEPGNSSVRELRRVAEARKLSLQGCNNDKAGLKKLDPRDDK